MKFLIKEGTIGKIGLIQYVLNVASVFRNPIAMINPMIVFDLILFGLTKSTIFTFVKITHPYEDGTVTETVLSIRQPLRAGQLKILKGWIGDDGDVRTHDHTVGVSVTLNWNDGGHHDIDL